MRAETPARKRAQVDAEQARAAVEECACLALRRAARTATQLYDHVLRDSGLRSTQFAVLVSIRERNRVTMKELSAAMAMDPTTLSRNLRPLERAGWITIWPGKKDRRERHLALTRKGQRRLARAYPLWERAQAQARSVLGRERLRRLRSDLAIVVAGSGSK